MLTDTEAHLVLGIEANADTGCIKRAYRRLAMHWHPDRNATPEALETFKRVRAAYVAMMERNTQEEAPEEAASEATSSAQKDRPRAADHIQDLTLTIEEAFLGCEKTVCTTQTESCSACTGTGEIELTHSRLCESCHGSGRIRASSGLSTCVNCAGRGYSKRAPCSQCDGAGIIGSQRQWSVRVPAGILSGEELRLEGKGAEPESEEMQAGDLRLRVQIAPHPIFTLEERDLVLERPVSAFRMLAGGIITVPYPGGKIEIDVSAGTAESRECRIDGAGMPARGKRRAGALRVRLVPVFPQGTTKALEKMYRELDMEITRDLGQHMPTLQSWEKTWLG